MGSCLPPTQSSTSQLLPERFHNPKMLSAKLAIALILALQLTSYYEVEGMGICFGGYPACCSGGKNVCGPFCASCRRASEFLRHMNMFNMIGFGMGTPAVFRLINPDPHAFPNRSPFPAPPIPVRGATRR